MSAKTSSFSTSSDPANAHGRAPLHLEADVLVIGGGMAAAWAAIGAARNGAAAAIAKRQTIAFGLGDPRWMARILDETWQQLPTLEGPYEFGRNEAGVTMYGVVRGPEYVRALRQVAEALGVRILDHIPALELLLHTDGTVAGARGVLRQLHEE